jgi:hypothetical protein
LGHDPSGYKREPLVPSQVDSLYAPGRKGKRLCLGVRVFSTTFFFIFVPVNFHIYIVSTEKVRGKEPWWLSLEERYRKFTLLCYLNNREIFGDFEPFGGHF